MIQWLSTPWRFVQNSIGFYGEEVMIMRHTENEIKEAARRFEKLTEELDPAAVQVDKIDDLREVAAASEIVRADEVRLREAVEVARAHGRSWNHIAIALGVSRQAARQRFARSETHSVSQ